MTEENMYCDINGYMVEPTGLAGRDSLSYIYDSSLLSTYHHRHHYHQHYQHHRSRNLLVNLFVSFGTPKMKAAYILSALLSVANAGMHIN